MNMKDKAIQLEMAEFGRQEGMQTALNHANDVVLDWGERALEMLKAFIAWNHDKFLAEDLRHWATEQGLPVPPHCRAWGPIMTKAYKAGLIAHRGHEKTVNPKAHRAICNLWQGVYDG